MADKNKKVLIQDDDAALEAASREAAKAEMQNFQQEMSAMKSEAGQQKVSVTPPAQAPSPAPSNNQMQNQVPDQYVDREFEIPTEQVALPSRGLFYPNNQAHVIIKYLTATEDDVLYSPDLIKSGRVLDILLQQGVTASELPLDDLLVADRNAILLALRKTGLGEEFNPGTYECPSCGENHEPTINLNDFVDKELTAMPDERGEFDFPLPILKKNVKVRLLTGQDEKVLGKSKPMPTKGGVKVNRYVTDRFTRQIMEVDGNRDKTYIRKLVHAMPMRDSIALREYMRIIEPGLDFTAQLECEHCGHVYDQEIVPNPVKLFYPDVEI